MNNEAFGLARAQTLLKVMMAYDYCFEAWDEPFRKWFSNQVYPVIFSLSATMSRHANYDMASNWMGVRYGTVLYASLVWDDYPKSLTSESGSRADALRFNAANRIEDFALANIH
ncbi:MAG: hypothetical protein HRU12_02355 [Phaeodactylibacter sp.]|nr:hypothetical protein [Phaeodactylibacter sp.]